MINFPEHTRLAKMHLKEIKINFKDDNVVIDGVGTVRWVRTAAKDGRKAGLGIEFLKLKKESIAPALQLIKKTGPIAFIPMG